MINIKQSARKLLANNIIYYRLKYNWSQEEFADRLGTTPNYVSYIENSKKNTRIDYIEHIAKTFNIEVSDLFKIRKPMETTRVPKSKRIK